MGLSHGAFFSRSKVWDKCQLSTGTECGYSFCNNAWTGHPHIDVLENFDPNLVSDPFKWIPKGLMLDLMDNTPTETLVNDQVSGYTIQQIFSALQSYVNSVGAYKASLIQQNPGNQTGVANLFTSYHY